MSLLNNIIIVCEESEQDSPIMIICLEGLVTKSIFDETFGYGIEIFKGIFSNIIRNNLS